MAVCFAIYTSDSNLLPCELYRLKERVSLVDGEKPNAAGMGWYSQDSVLLRRFPQDATPRTPVDLGRVEPSEVLLYQAGVLPVGTSIEENAQPFRHGRWLFAHAGQIRDSAKVRPRVVASLPNFLQRQVTGDTDSELGFALLLKFFRETRNTDDRIVNAPLAAQLLGRTVRTLEQFSAEVGATKTSELNFVATDGRVLCASRFGAAPLYYALLEGTAQCARCKLDPSVADMQPMIRAHRRHRSVVIASHVTDPPAWFELPNGTVLAVDSQLNLQRMPI